MPYPDKKQVKKDVKFLIDFIYRQIWDINWAEKNLNVELYMLKPGMLNRMEFMEIRNRYGIKGKYTLGGRK